MLTTEQTPCPRLFDEIFSSLDHDGGHQRLDGPSGREEPAEELHLRSEMRTLLLLDPEAEDMGGRQQEWTMGGKEDMLSQEDVRLPSLGRRPQSCLSISNSRQSSRAGSHRSTSERAEPSEASGSVYAHQLPSD